MLIARFITIVSLVSVAACAANTPGEPVRRVTDRLEVECKQTTEEACLATNECAWGDQGIGPQCFFVGPVEPQPGTDGGPATPSVCSHPDLASCLADDGCAWGDQGNGPECLFVGPVVAQPGNPSSPSGCAHDTETVCVNADGCAWGDQGKGPECFYVGQVDAEAPKAPPPGGNAKDGGGCSMTMVSPGPTSTIAVLGAALGAALAIRRRRHRTAAKD